MTELADLPAPVLVEELSFEVIKAAMVADLAARDPAYTAILESDPVIKAIEVSAYRELLLRQRVNEALRANLLAFAVGSDIDHLAHFYDVTRLAGETDEELRARVVLAIRGRSTGGTEPRYRSVARAAHPRVADAAVYTVGKDPTVRVAVFSKDNNGVADAAILAAVNAALQAPAVRMVNDTIVVAPASRVAVNVAANVWLLPEAGEDATIAAMDAALRAAWASAMVLGRDVTRAWLVAKLMVEGVQRVEITAPGADLVVPFNEAAALGTVTLTSMGRAF